MDRQEQLAQEHHSTPHNINKAKTTYHTTVLILRIFVGGITHHVPCPKRPIGRTTTPVCLYTVGLCSASLSARGGASLNPPTKNHPEKQFAHLKCTAFPISPSPSRCPPCSPSSRRLSWKPTSRGRLGQWSFSQHVRRVVPTTAAR